MWQAAWLLDQGRRATLQSSFAKRFAADTAMKVTTDVRREPSGAAVLAVGRPAVTVTRTCPREPGPGDCHSDLASAGVAKAARCRTYPCRRATAGSSSPFS